MERVIFMFPKVVLLVMSSRGALGSNVVSWPSLVCLRWRINSVGVDQVSDVVRRHLHVKGGIPADVRPHTLRQVKGQSGMQICLRRGLRQSEQEREGVAKNQRSLESSRSRKSRPVAIIREIKNV
jgi:hypothetical protein